MNASGSRNRIADNTFKKHHYESEWRNGEENFMGIKWLSSVSLCKMVGIGTWLHNEDDPVEKTWWCEAKGIYWTQESMVLTQSTVEGLTLFRERTFLRVKTTDSIAFMSLLSACFLKLLVDGSQFLKNNQMNSPTEIGVWIAKKRCKSPWKPIGNQYLNKKETNNSIDYFPPLLSFGEENNS